MARGGASALLPSSLVRQIDRKRRAAGVSVSRLTALAGVDDRSYRRNVKDGRYARRSTVAKLEAALKRAVANKSLNVPQHELIRSTYRVHLAARAEALGLDVARCLAADAGDIAAWKYATPARWQAIYMTVIALNLQPVRMAEALELSRPAITKILQGVEDSRDDPEIDHALNEYEQIMGGTV